MMSAVARPGPNTSLTPTLLRRVGVLVGDRAADEEQDVLAVVLAQHPAELLAYSMCAPDRLESPSTSASSWITARRIDSGVWKMPV